MANCAKCGAVLMQGAGFCGSCGAAVGAAPAVAAQASAPTAVSTGGLTANVAGALAYFTIIPAIIFLVVEPYNKDRFIKFHAFQSIIFFVALVAVSIATAIVGVILNVIPIVGGIISVLLWLAIMVGLFCLWLYTMYKAYNNQKFMIPVLGNLAEQQASK